MNAMTENPKTSPALSPQELAKALNVHPTTVTRAVAENRIRAIKIGRLLRIPPDEAERCQREGF